MSTRQIAGLLAAAAPEVVPPRDTLRTAAPDRYTLKVTIDQECEQGLRLLKGLLSHLDPRMSWGDLVARLVREAVARHDPRGGGRGQRRKGAGSAGASPRRAPNKTRAAGAAAGPAQRANESSRRASNRIRAAVAPAAPPRRGGGDTPAPPGETATAGSQNPIAMVANAAAVQPPAPRRLAAMPALPCRSRQSPLRRRSPHAACSLTADSAAHQPEQRRTRPAILFAVPTNPRHAATFPRLFGAMSGNATADAAAIRIRLCIILNLPRASFSGRADTGLGVRSSIVLGTRSPSCYAGRRSGTGQGPAL